jgi:hypothetical protein
MVGTLVRDDPAPPAPSVAEVRAKLEDLIRGEIMRQEVSAWALRWVDARDPGDIDPPVWRALQELAGADLPDWDREYLHGPEDFAAWRDALDEP